MLLYDVPYGYVPSLAVADGDAKHPLGFKDPERVMSKCTMPKIAKSLPFRRRASDAVNVVLRLSAKATHGGLRMKKWVSHTPSCSVVS